MKQLSFNFSAHKAVFSDQDYVKLQKELKETKQKLEQYREQLRIYNSLSRKKHGNKCWLMSEEDRQFNKRFKIIHAKNKTKCKD